MLTHNHTRWEADAENKIDPDDGNSTLCEACRLPIFYTPFIPTTPFDQNNNNNNNRALHDQCANDHLPTKLERRHPLHPKKDLILQHQHQTNINYCCSRCDSLCGTSFYKCGGGDDDDRCRFRLDLACALTIKIVHRSYPHRLTAIRGKSLSSLLCAACGTRHDQQQASTWQVYYTCDFWIHTDCALLPNAIHIDVSKHSHPLLLMYLNYRNERIKECGICGRGGDYPKFSGLGCYSCFHCGYIVHMKCVVYSDPRDDPIHFEPVKIRDAQVPGLLHLPMPNETTNVMAHILTKTAAFSSLNDDSMITNDKIHEHPLILHDHHDDDDDDISNRICNACVQLISPSESFYSCCTTTTNNNNNNNNNELDDGCRDFFVHRCCVQLLPTEITAKHWSHFPRCRNESLTLVSKPAGGPFNMFDCGGCGRKCNGFAYVCEKCNFHVDAVCAFMHTSIAHHAHASSHILLPDIYLYNLCVCCGHFLDPSHEIGYVCNSCHDFKIHGKCALLPDTVAHKFDTHPLKLITTTQKAKNTDDGDHQRMLVRGEQMFCEICENDIDDARTWYYGCKQCDNYFHTGCIPCLDRLSKIKFRFTIRVACHACPLTCVRALSVDGYRCQCGTCDRIIIIGSDELAFECSECYFRIRRECAARDINDIS